MGFIILAVFGTICALIASSRGRSAVGWFFCGFFFPIIGLILVLVLPDLKEEASRRQRDTIEKQRLRERLRQEQMKNETFRRYANQRLDTHDKALSLDTRETHAALASGMAPPELLRAPSQAPATPEVPPVAPVAPVSPLVETLSPEPAADKPAPGAPSLRGWYYEFQGKTIGPVQQRVLADMFRHGQLPRETLVCEEEGDEWQPAATVPFFRADA